MKFICEIFSRIDVTFRDESNESNSTIIDYNNTTVTAPNHFSNRTVKDIISYSTATVL